MSLTVDISRKKNRGMTLVEMIVAMAIFTIIMGSVMVMFNTITNTVRRGYRTMDLFEATHGALMTIERDIQTAFSAPAIGEDFHFYGEPNGFIFVGIAPDGKLGRLTYAVHADTSRMEDPHLPFWRGERMSVMLEVEDNPGQFQEYEIEVLYGVLTRFYEQDVTNVSKFPLLDIFAGRDSPPFLPPPRFAVGNESAYRAAGLPWFFGELYRITGGAGIPRSTWEKLEAVELCHYWLQLLSGPYIEPPKGWGHPLAIQYSINQFWFDHIPFRYAGMTADGLEQYPNPYLFEGEYSVDFRSFLWDHVIARDFAIAAWVLDPGTGNRIDDATKKLDIKPVFHYNVESGLIAGNDEEVFNTLFNLDSTDSDFEILAGLMTTTTPDVPAIESTIQAITVYRDLYNLGSPLQSRLPSSFDIRLTVINPPVTMGGATDRFTFSQTIHLPSGFRRRNLAID